MRKEVIVLLFVLGLIGFIGIFILGYSLGLENNKAEVNDLKSANQNLSNSNDLYRELYGDALKQLNETNCSLSDCLSELNKIKQINEKNQTDFKFQFLSFEFDRTQLTDLLILCLGSFILIIPLNIAFKLLTLEIKSQEYKKFYNGFMFGAIASYSIIFILFYINAIEYNQGLYGISFIIGIVMGFMNLLIYKIEKK